MSSNVEYLFTNETTDGALVFRSTVNSFGLDHVTDKDMFSFFTRFSNAAYFDSGLLPVQGSGVLSIRSALNHTQVAYQHAPGSYYINWGEIEGDANAVKYLVAQPYRIVIIDFVNNNLLGARTFYSPIPVTHPDVPLYHVNLPNINCRGYRGNGVGWICLYHTDDTSTYPFSEQLHKALERCSGVEAYNNANMSETDGTRFYSEFRPQNSFIYNPTLWEEKTIAEGWEWTLDETLWIPVLVQDFDHQDRHDHDGVPLTFVDALFGDYKAYYSDALIPKPVNAIARHDRSLSSDQMFNAFKVSYMGATDSINPLSHINTFDAAAKIKTALAHSFTPPPTAVYDEDDDDDSEDD